MSSPYVGEIRLIAGFVAPKNWRYCDGTLLQISEYDMLFMWIGTTYGGDGETTFALPNMAGRVPLHMGQGVGLSAYSLGAPAGQAAVALTTSAMPGHSHTPGAANLQGMTRYPIAGESILASAANPANQFYSPGPLTTSPGVQLDPASVANAPPGPVVAHQNMTYTMALNYIICVKGIFPA